VKKGSKHSEETKRRMSLANKGKNHPLWGKKRSEKTKRKIGLTNASKVSLKKENHPRWGKKQTEETKRKISIAKKGRKHTEETRKKMSLARIGEKHPFWKGGRRKDKGGYIYILTQPCTGHYVFEHRLVIEKQIGRHLKPEEIGHHLGDITDNRPHMLMAFTSASAHQRFHNNPDNVKPEEIIFDGRKLKQGGVNEK
jgi:hypothetical protein